MTFSHQDYALPPPHNTNPASITTSPALPSDHVPLFLGDPRREGRQPGDDIELLGSESRTSPSIFTRSKDEAARAGKEIKAILRMLTRLEAERFSFAQTADDEPERLFKNLSTDHTLRAYLVKLKEKENILEWRALASRRSMFNLDPVVVERLLDIQKDSASAVGALAVVGATLAYSTMYSGTRGSMWYPFIAWWMFIVSMATTSGLSLAAAGSSISKADDLLETDTSAESSTNLTSATPRNWLFQKLSVVAVGFSLIGAAGGWAMLAAGATSYSLYHELHDEGPAISAGPDLGPHGITLTNRLITYFVIGFFVIILIGGYFYRLRPRFHAKEYKTVFLSGQPQLSA